MAVTGYLVDFSLPEIFKFLEQGNKTGLLTIQSLGSQADQPSFYYIWFYQGRIVAAAERLDRKGLVSLIGQRGWASDRAASKLGQVCQVGTPLGLCLKSQGVLQAEQLKLLFQVQVFRQVCALFALTDGQFSFDSKAALPQEEMTGLSLPATEATLLGLRSLRNWSALLDKLPDPSFALQSIFAGQPQYRLDNQEWQVWEFTNGTASLLKIAEQLRLPIGKVQQIAFRLIVVGLAEEIPLFIPVTTIESAENLHDSTGESADRQNVSNSFMQSLLGFLRSKV